MLRSTSATPFPPPSNIGNEAGMARPLDSSVASTGPRLPGIQLLTGILERRLRSGEDADFHGVHGKEVVLLQISSVAMCRLRRN